MRLAIRSSTASTPRWGLTIELQPSFRSKTPGSSLARFGTQSGIRSQPAVTALFAQFAELSRGDGQQPSSEGRQGGTAAANRLVQGDCGDGRGWFRTSDISRVKRCLLVIREPHDQAVCAASGGLDAACQIAADYARLPGIRAERRFLPTGCPGGEQLRG